MTRKITRTLLAAAVMMAMYSGSAFAQDNQRPAWLGPATQQEQTTSQNTNQNQPNMKDQQGAWNQQQKPDTTTSHDKTRQQPPTMNQGNDNKTKQPWQPGTWNKQQKQDTTTNQDKTRQQPPTMKKDNNNKDNHSWKPDSQDQQNYPDQSQRDHKIQNKGCP